ncbi:unnamed protein product [Adineta ricciae]|uniref:Uncharacterized protein n=1 Tax=Adineta ricciae TaxID=249248 RepID=A0A815MGD3_ADIRI|nr:unnamed protein product [Adineta ricciae]
MSIISAFQKQTKLIEAQVRQEVSDVYMCTIDTCITYKKLNFFFISIHSVCYEIGVSNQSCPTKQNRIRNCITFVKLHKCTAGKRIWKFFSKLLWHFNQTVPNYSPRENRRAKLYTRRGSVRHSREQQTGVTKTHIQVRYIARHRTCSTRQRQTTLTSIAEENENDLLNYK